MVSDGPGDCARTCEREARELAEEKWPGILVWENQYHPPKPEPEDYVLIYEEYIDHYLEKVHKKKVTHRYLVGMHKDKAKELELTDRNNYPGAMEREGYSFR